MNEWLLVIVAATVGSLLSLVGGLYLLYGKKGTMALQKLAVPFAAGALLAAAFLNLLPEAIEADSDDGQVVFATALVGFILFFVLERGLSWFHHHHDEAEVHASRARTAWLIIIGDTLHNFIDGLVIGAAFLVDPMTGIVATVAIAAHEVPQEIGDFGLLISKGLAKKQVLYVSLASALATVFGASLAFGVGSSLELPLSILLSLAAGFFIYIAASDIIPTIHAETRRKVADIQTVVLIIGIVFVGLVANYAHSFMPDDHTHHGETRYHDND